MEEIELDNSRFNPELVAPCGMDCRICSRYLAFEHEVKNQGIRIPYCIGCRPRNRKCAWLKKRCNPLLDNKVQYCYECTDFPCRKLQHIDKRYRTFYRMSMIKNLKIIKENGVTEFLKIEEKKWQCPTCGEVICCHNGICFSCELDKLTTKKKLLRWKDDGQ